jgi:hypothetical protein
MFKKFLLAAFLLFIFPSVVLATIGVGVGTGKIVVTEKLHAGIVYKLPSLTVVNTGDEPANYSVDVAYMEKQEEAKPDKSWFSFDPLTFHLDPGQTQSVDITLTLPLKVVPDQYFAYLEGFPAKGSGGGQTTIGVAAAAKLYFEIVPSNFFEGVYYRVLSLWKNNQPYTNIAGGVLVAVIAVVLFRRFFNFEINVKKGGKENKPEDGADSEPNG